MSVWLWLILAAMSAGALALLLPPLLGWRGRDTAPRAAYDAEIYRDQLAELEHDLERGVLTADQAEAARTEIARRLLATEDSGGQGRDVPARANFCLAATLVGIAVPAGAVLLYLILGAPELTDPAKPQAVAASQPAQPAEDMSAMVTELGNRLKARPDDARGWSLYARSLAGLKRFEEAVPAFRRATSLNPDNLDLLSRMAEAQIFATDGTVTPAAMETLERIISRQPNEPRALYYLGLADNQAGRPRQGLDRWIRLEAVSPPDAPWRKLLSKRIGNLAMELGINRAGLAALRARAGDMAKPAPAGPGLGAVDIKAAARISAGERGTMIGRMVKHLAGRLAENPDDPDNMEDWLKLARSYGVLGKQEKAKEALARAETARKAIFAKGARAYDGGDYEAAFGNWHRLARGGNAKAQTAIAGMFRSGNGRVVDMAQAALWYSRAAGQGEPVAQMSLGEMYRLGLGVKRDRIQAYVLFTRAAAQGKTWVATELGKLVATMTTDELAIAAGRLRLPLRP